MDQPGKVANPGRGQLNSENYIFFLSPSHVGSPMNRFTCASLGTAADDILHVSCTFYILYFIIVQYRRL